MEAKKECRREVDKGGARLRVVNREVLEARELEAGGRVGSAGACGGPAVGERNREGRWSSGRRGCIRWTSGR